MEKQFLSKNSLFDLLGQAVNECSNPAEIVQKIKTELSELLMTSLGVQEWPVEHFLSLAVGLYFVEKINEPNYVADDDPYYQGRNTLKAVPKSIDDVKKMLQDAGLLYEQKLEVLQSAINANEVSNPSLPINWLELAQKTKGRTSGTHDNSAAIFSDRNIHVPYAMAAQIRYSYYKVDASIAEDGFFPVSRYSVSEAAKEVGVSVDELIAECFKNDFGIYLKQGRFKIKQFIHSPITRSTISSTATFSYTHHYKGHLRIMKSSVFYPDATLEKIYQGGVIEVDPRDTYALVPIQPSVAQCSQGLSVLIELRRGETITLDDFVLIKDEIDQYKAKRLRVADAPNEPTEAPSPSNESQRREERSQESLSQGSLVEVVRTVECSPGVEGARVAETAQAFTTAGNLAVDKAPIPVLEAVVEKNTFARKGVVFEMRYKGHVAHSPIKLGEKYIEQLLKNPRKNIDSLRLVQQINSNAPDAGSIESAYELDGQGICDNPFTGGSHQPVFDGQTMIEIKQKLKEMDAELEEAMDCNDTDTIERLKNDKMEIMEEVSANMKLNKQSRAFSTPVEQARQSVRQNIGNALKRIKKAHPELHEHLTLYLKTGFTCQYCPPEGIIWD